MALRFWALTTCTEVILPFGQFLQPIVGMPNSQRIVQAVFEFHGRDCCNLVMRCSYRASYFSDGKWGLPSLGYRVACAACSLFVTTLSSPVIYSDLRTRLCTSGCGHASVSFPSFSYLCHTFKLVLPDRSRIPI